MGKQTAFDTDIRVPLIVAGPGVPAARSCHRWSRTSTWLRPSHNLAERPRRSRSTATASCRCCRAGATRHGRPSRSSNTKEATTIPPTPTSKAAGATRRHTPRFGSRRKPCRTSADRSKPSTSNTPTRNTRSSSTTSTKTPTRPTTSLEQLTSPTARRTAHHPHRPPELPRRKRLLGCSPTEVKAPAERCEPCEKSIGPVFTTWKLRRRSCNESVTPTPRKGCTKPPTCSGGGAPRARPTISLSSSGSTTSVAPKLR